MKKLIFVVGGGTIKKDFKQHEMQEVNLFNIFWQQNPNNMLWKRWIFKTGLTCARRINFFMKTCYSESNRYEILNAEWDKAKNVVVQYKEGGDTENALSYKHISQLAWIIRFHGLSVYAQLYAAVKSKISDFMHTLRNNLPIETHYIEVIEEVNFAEMRYVANIVQTNIKNLAEIYSHTCAFS